MTPISRLGPDELEQLILHASNTSEAARDLRRLSLVCKAFSHAAAKRAKLLWASLGPRLRRAVEGLGMQEMHRREMRPRVAQLEHILLEGGIELDEEEILSPSLYNHVLAHLEHETYSLRRFLMRRVMPMIWLLDEEARSLSMFAALMLVALPNVHDSYVTTNELFGQRLMSRCRFLHMQRNLLHDIGLPAAYLARASRQAASTYSTLLSSHRQQLLEYFREDEQVRTSVLLFILGFKLEMSRELLLCVDNIDWTELDGLRRGHHDARLRERVMTSTKVPAIDFYTHLKDFGSFTLQAESWLNEFAPTGQVVTSGPCGCCTRTVMGRSCPLCVYACSQGEELLRHLWEDHYLVPKDVQLPSYDTVDGSCPCFLGRCNTSESEEDEAEFESQEDPR